MRILDYTCNLFAFPDDYFTSRTAAELQLTEEDRQEIIRQQQEAKRYRDNSTYRATIQEKRRQEEQEFLKMFEELQ